MITPWKSPQGMQDLGICLSRLPFMVTSNCGPCQLGGWKTSVCIHSPIARRWNMTWPWWCTLGCYLRQPEWLALLMQKNPVVTTSLGQNVSLCFGGSTDLMDIMFEQLDAALHNPAVVVTPRIQCSSIASHGMCQNESIQDCHNLPVIQLCHLINV